MTFSDELVQLLAIVLPLIHGIGLLLALDAIWQARTSQGAISWAIALISFPYLGIPLYLVFGRTRFHGYVRARRSHDSSLKQISAGVLNEVTAVRVFHAGEAELPSFRVLQRLARMPFTKGNAAEVLVDGEATFAAIFGAIAQAKQYVLVQFFIGRGDELGQRLATLLKKKAAEGVRCYYLYDEVGSRTTPRSYWRDLRENGVKAAPFNTQRGGWRNRFQINFRNHRKIVVVDGERAFVGGHNVGDDYLGKGPLGPWRDTHVVVQGPVVPAIQLSFVEDWHWATDEVLPLDWKIRPSAGENSALALPTGPADDADLCTLMFCQIIYAARQRVWIATPYFVPDAQVMVALQLAALRGVEVRVLLPEKPDHFPTHFASFAPIETAENLGVRFFRFPPAFPHQKVVLVDNVGGAIGTANLDNRSLHLNFEITLLFAGEQIAGDIHKMLEHDFAHAVPVPLGVLATKSFFFRLAVRIANLFAPIL